MSLAAVGAIGVFVLVVGYVSGINRQVGPLTTAYEFTRNVSQLQPITSQDLRTVKIPTRWIPRAAIQSFDVTRGLVATQNIQQGAILQAGMADHAPELQPSQVEIAIMINAETGVAGEVQAGDLVDIYGTFQNQTTSKGNARSQTQARIVVQKAKVLSIGALQRVDAPTADKSGVEQDQVVPVTFALSRSDSLAVAYAESFATKVRLVRIPPGTNPPVDRHPVLTDTQVFGSGS